MSETVKEKNDRLLKAGFAFFEGLAKDPENNMFSNAIAVGRLIQDTEIRARSETADEIDALKAQIETTNSNLRQIVAKFRPDRDVRDADTDRLIHLISGEIKDYMQRTSQYIEERDARVAVLENALRYYADIPKYKAPMIGGDLYFDCGDTAIKALEARHDTN
jgi:hypothetical protein